MLNWFRRLTDSDSARLRRLEVAVAQLQDDTAKALYLMSKVQARLGARARKAAEEADSDEVELTTSPQTVPLLSAAAGEPRRMTRDELMARARARGIR